MGMHGKEITKLPVDHPTHCTVGIFTLDTKHSFMRLHGMETVTNPYAQTMEEDRDAPMPLLVVFEPQM
jgi:hypothetical protein